MFAGTTSSMLAELSIQTSFLWCNLSQQIPSPPKPVGLGFFHHHLGIYPSLKSTSLPAGKFVNKNNPLLGRRNAPFPIGISNEIHLQLKTVGLPLLS